MKSLFDNWCLSNRMLGDEELEGFNLIQCPEVSSSSDILFRNFRPRIINTLHRSHFQLDRPVYSRFLRSYIQRRQGQFYFQNNNDYLDRIHNQIYVPQNPDVIPPSVPIESQKCKSSLPTRYALLSVALIFICSFLLLLLVYANFPHVTNEEQQHIRIPWNIEQAKKLGIVLSRYKDDHYFSVLMGVFLTYIFLQTFAIPGSLFLSILSGFLFPFYFALTLVCTCSALGASLCFLLSQLLGRRLVLKYFPERAAKWAEIVERHSDNLLNYMIFLRVTPFLPNWFINLTAPVIGVPLVPFALGTFLGVAPPSFVAIQAGQTLHKMTSSDTGFSWTSVLLLATFAVISLIPVFIKQKLKEKFE